MTMETQVLLPHHIDNLRSSCLSDEFLEQYRDLIFSLSNERMLLDAIGRKSWPPGVRDGIAFVYPNDPEFVRVKTFLKDDLDPNEKKPPRYLTRHKEKPRLYIALLAQKIIIDFSKEIALVEGEKKCLSLEAHGIPAIGFGGSWSHLSKGQAIADFDKIAWMTRTVKLYCDSNTWHQKEVMRGIYVLGKELAGRQADLIIVQIPCTADGKDQGIDDYLFNGGDLDQLVEHSFKKKFAQEKTVKRWYIGWDKKQERDEEEKQSPLPEDIKEAAEALLNDPYMLKRFLDICKALGCVGEDDVLTMLFLAMTSRLLKKPVNLIVKGASSAGKNFVTQTVAKLIPPDAINIISSLTPKALFHLDADLSYTILVVAEAPGSDEGIYPLRTMMSEGEIVLLIPEKTSHGTLRTVTKRIQGPLCWITTTTSVDLEEESQTRTFDIYVDESEKQTERIFQMQSKEAKGMLPSDTDKLIKIWQAVQDQLEIVDVIIPFAEHIDFPNHPIRMRRDRVRFFSLIQACTLLHQHQRAKDDRGRIIATLDDFVICRGLVIKSLMASIVGVKPKTVILVKAAATIEGIFTKADLKKCQVEIEDQNTKEKVIHVLLRWTRRDMDRYVDDAVRAGCFKQVGDSKPGASTKYQYESPVEEAICPLPTSEKIQEKMKAES